MPFTKRYTFAPLPSTARGESIKLDGDKKNEKFIYANGRSIFIRDFKHPAIATEYVGHQCQTTVARYSPSGYYVASGDIRGNVRIWDTVNEERILKSESRPLSAKVRDLAWDADSKRVIAGGDGKEKFGHAFFFDTLSSVGEIVGHTKQINSVSIRQQRPFRAVTSSDDFSVSFFHGVPFKWVKQIRDHTRFVHCVQYSPNGDHFVSAGADGKIFLYDGSTADKVGELSDGGHTGGIFSLSWSPDSTQLLSSSADFTAKIWDLSKQKAVSTFNFDKSAIENQQLGNLWKGDWLLSTSLSGEINYLDKNSGKVSRTIDGHVKAITSLSTTTNDTFFTGSFDGRVYAWPFGEKDEDKKAAVHVSGDGHRNQIVTLSIQGDSIYSAGMDDTVRKASVTERQFSDKTVSTGAMPLSLSTSKDGVIAVATNDGVELYDADLKKIGQENKLGYEPSVVGISNDGKQVYVGSKGDNKFRVYDHKEGQLSLVKELERNSRNVTALAVHPNERLVASGDAGGKIYVYNVDTGEVVVDKWFYHSARITSLCWSSCGELLVSGSLDTHVYVWSRKDQHKYVAIKNAHVDSVNNVSFLQSANEKQTVVSTGQDAAVRIWEVEMP